MRRVLFQTPVGLSRDWRHTRGLGIWFAVVMVIFYAPLAIQILYAFNDNHVVTIWTHPSLRWFAAVIRNPDLQSAALNSLEVALGAAVISVVAALGAALALRSGLRRRPSLTLVGLVNLPLVVPEIVVAVTTLVLFSSLNLNLGLWNIVIAHAVFCVPVAFLPINASLGRIDKVYDAVARDLYAREIDIFRLILIPLLKPALFSGFVLAFVTSLDDFLISLMVARAGTTTLPVYVYSMMRVGVTPEVNAVSTFLTGIPVIAFVSVLLVLRQGRSARNAGPATL